MWDTSNWRSTPSSARTDLIAPDHMLTCPKCLDLYTRETSVCPNCGCRFRLTARELRELRGIGGGAA